MKVLLKFVWKWFLLWIWFTIWFFVIYAAWNLINSVQDWQTINKWDQIWSGWFQEVNDKMVDIIKWRDKKWANKDYVKSISSSVERSFNAAMQYSNWFSCNWGQWNKLWYNVERWNYIDGANFDENNYTLTLSWGKYYVDVEHKIYQPSDVWIRLITVDNNVLIKGEKTYASNDSVNISLNGFLNLSQETSMYLEIYPEQWNGRCGGVIRDHGDIPWSSQYANQFYVEKIIQ